MANHKPRAIRQQRAVNRKHKRVVKASRKSNNAIARKAAHNAARGLKGSHPKMGVTSHKSRPSPVSEPLRVTAPMLQLILPDWLKKPVYGPELPPELKSWTKGKAA